jgi:hypothetical protein
VSAVTLLEELRDRGVGLAIDQGRLRVDAEAGLLTEADKAAVREHCDELIEALAVLDRVRVAHERYGLLAVAHAYAGPLLDADANRLAELEPLYQEAKAEWFAALDEQHRVCFPEEDC